MEKSDFRIRIAEIKEKISRRNIDAEPFNQLFDEYESIRQDFNLQSADSHKTPVDFLLALREELSRVQQKILDMEATCKAILDE